MLIPKKKDGPQLVAELSVFTAADALQWAQSSRLTGRLSFRSEDSRITLIFEKGGLVYAASRDRKAAFGRHLFSEGLVDEVDLAAAMVYSRDNQQRIGAVVVELGILDEDTVRHALHEHTLNLAAMPLGWTEGWVSAERKESEAAPNPVPRAVDSTFLLMEAARRVDETAAIRQLLPDDLSRVALGDLPAPDNLSPRHRRLIEALTRPLSVTELYEAIGGSHFLFLEALHQLVEAGVIEIADPFLAASDDSLLDVG